MGIAIAFTSLVVFVLGIIFALTVINPPESKLIPDDKTPADEFSAADSMIMNNEEKRLERQKNNASKNRSKTTTGNKPRKSKKQTKTDIKSDKPEQRNTHLTPEEE